MAINSVNIRGYFITDKSFCDCSSFELCSSIIIMAFKLKSRGKRCAMDQLVRCLSMMRKVSGLSTRRCRVRCKTHKNNI